MQSRRLLPIIAAVLGCVSLASAHEFWVRPSQFEAAPGQLGRFFLMHGHRFEGEFVPRNEPYVKRFEIVDAQGTQQVMGRHGQPTNVARLRTAGTSVVAYESEEVLSELGPERFAAYLEEQGLDHIATQRKALGETNQPGIEMYARCAKALVRVGEDDAGLEDRVVGLPLELVLEPLESASARQQARVRVLYQGEPMVDARVVAVSQQAAADGASSAQVVRTDAEGYAPIDLELAGPWMVTCLHMFRTDDRDDADWKSFWASLTFAVGEG